MLSNLLAILPGNGGTVAGQVQSPDNYYFDNYGEAALYALIGLVVVFVGIVVIIGVIWFVGFIMKKTNNFEFLTKKRTKKADTVKEVQTTKEENTAADTVKEVQTTKEENTASVTSDEIPDEVKAAIIAAIMAYYQEKEDKCQFTVKRIKRI